MAADTLWLLGTTGPWANALFDPGASAAAAESDPRAVFAAAVARVWRRFDAQWAAAVAAYLRGGGDPARAAAPVPMARDRGRAQLQGHLRAGGTL